jgi:purine nucleosidase
VTEKTIMSTAALARLDGATNARARHIARIVPYYARFYRQRLGLDGICVHDSTTISYLLAPELYNTVSHPIRVDTAHGVGRGKTWPATRVSDHETPWSGRRDVTICVGVDSDAVVEMEIARLLAPDQ